MTVSVGDTLSLEITALVHGGFGIARHDGFVVFVPGALPDERVVVEVYKKAKSHAFADLLEVSSAHPQRTPHIWPEADVSHPPLTRAGGADFGHIAVAFQRVLKSEIVRDALIRMGKLEPEAVAGVSVEAIPGATGGAGYRTRVSLQVDSEGRAGPFAERSHTVIPVSSLPLATTGIGDLGAHFSRWPGRSQIRLLQPSRDEARVVEDSHPPQPITEWVGDTAFELDDRVFWQVHQHAPATLTTALTSMLSGVEIDPDDEHWDLYGGVGLFARTLIDWAGPESRVRSVEADPVASGFATRNLEAYPHARAVASSTMDFLRQYSRDLSGNPARRLGVVVLDPPRSGAGREVITAIARARPRAVIYIACDPVALARDVATLSEHGYHLESLQAFDLFPHTHHVEAVGLFLRG